LGVFFEARLSSSSLLSSENSISLYDTLPEGRFRDFPPEDKIRLKRGQKIWHFSTRNAATRGEHSPLCPRQTLGTL
jgi:hypothetical protein